MKGEKGIVRDSLVIPREVLIYCSGIQTVAFHNWVERTWKCGRCGAKVKVSW